MKFFDRLRAAARVVGIVAAFPVLGALIAAQAFVIGPLTRNYNTVPKIVYKTMCALFGYKVVFNKASAPLVKDKRVFFVANHMATVDPFVLGSALKGTFAGKAEILQWPLIAQMARGIKFIGLKRSKDFNAESRARIIQNFNDGYNTIMFPEGTSHAGKVVHMFHAGLITPLFGEKGVYKGKEVALEQDVVVQPVAVRVKYVNGRDAIGSDELRNTYSVPTSTHLLKGIWSRLQVRRTVLELTVLPALDPKDYADAKGLINKAAADVAGIVNPGQTEFTKASFTSKFAEPKSA